MIRIVPVARAPRTLRLVASAAVFLGTSLAWADAASDLQAGISLLRQGKREEADKKFREVLAADPSNEDAYNLVKSTDYQVFLDMLKSGGDAEQAAKRILSLSTQVEVQKSKDPEAIKALVETAVNSKELDQRETANRQLAGAHGQHAVPYLVPYLGSNDIDTRANAILALTRIGSDAVMPLAASLQTGSDLQKQVTVKLLQRIGDERSEPAMAAARGEKAEAARKHLAMAKKYFHGDMMTVRNFDRSFAIWTVKDGKLEAREVSRFVYNYELAEQSAYDALALEPGMRDARAMIALTTFAEQAACENLSQEALANEQIKAQCTALENAPAVAAATGTAGLLDAFRLGMELKNAEAAAKVADAIPGVWDDRPIGPDNPLVQGLANEDNTIRYSAAIALLRINPAQQFPGSNTVAKIAGDAAASRAVRQVLVVDTDTKNAANAQRALNGAGFHAVAANSGAEGLTMAKATGGFDAVVVSSKLADMSVFQVLSDLGRDFRTQSAKKIVMTAGGDLGANKAEYDKYNLAGVAPTSTDAAGVVNAVKTATATPEGDLGRVRANRLSIAASNALAGADRGAFNRRDAEKGLLAAAGEGADPEVALAALNALSKIASPESQTQLRAMVAAKETPPAQRIAAARALGATLRGQTPAKETVAVLIEAMGDADVGVRTAAGAALGSAKLTPEQQAEVLSKRRVE